MAFFPKLDDRIELYDIKRQPGTPYLQLFEAAPNLQKTALKQYPDFDSARAAVKVLNEAVQKFQTVRIAPLRKGREGQGFDYFAVQRVLDGAFLSISDQFMRGGLYDSTTLHFDTQDEAENKAKSLNYQIETM
jgi:hypothetical protein